MPSFIDYDSVGDKLYFLSEGTYLTFTVKLSKKDKDGCRNHYHKEYMYPSNQYLDKSTGVTIKRDFDYYLAIENKKEEIFIQIRMENMIGLNMILQNLVQILLNDNVWAVKNNRLVLKGNINPMSIDLPLDKWLSFEPLVLEYEQGFSKGVRIILSQNDKFVDLDIDKFMGLVYLLSNFNMYQSALSIVNYLNWREYGTNLVTFSDGSSNMNEGSIKSPNGRKIPTKAQKQKSFFDLN